MKIITNLLEANETLRIYFGANVNMMIFSPSLHRIAWQLKSEKHSNVVYVVGIGCERISGSLSWSNGEIQIDQFSHQHDEVITKISDKRNCFELITSSGFSIAMGEQFEFGNSFDDFIKDGIVQ